MNEEEGEPTYCRIQSEGPLPPRRFITREWINWMMAKYDGAPGFTTFTAVGRGARRLVQEEFTKADWANKEPVCAPGQNTDSNEDIEIYIYHVERTRV